MWLLFSLVCVASIKVWKIISGSDEPQGSPERFPEFYETQNEKTT